MRTTSSEDVLIVSLARAARALVRRLDNGRALALGRALGRLVWSVSKRRRIALRNLRSVYAGQLSEPEIRRIARRSFENLGMNMIELLRFPEMDARYLHQHVTVRGREHLERSLGGGKGVILLTAHFGNWELLNTVSSLFGYRMVALARKQKHPRADAFLNGLRESKGNRIVYKGFGVREILRTLRDGGIVGILSDQDGGRGGVFVRFFGRLSSTPAGVATFALRSGAPIHPVFIFREGDDHHRIEVGPALAPPAPGADEISAERQLLSRFAEGLEAAVRRAPDQWLWAHRRWKSTPDRQVAVLSDGKAGHLSQSLGFVRELVRRRAEEWPGETTVRSRVIEVRYRSERRRAVCAALGRLCGGRVPARGALLRWALEPASAAELTATHADIVVSAGSSLALCNLHLSSLSQARSVVVMDPGLPRRLFAALIVPQHDKISSGSNVYRTLASLSALDPSDVERSGRELRERLALGGRALVGVLIGGDVQGGPAMDRPGLERMIDALKSHVKRRGGALLVTTSRRTPAWACESLKKRLSDKELCPLLVIASEHNPPETVPGILGAADSIVVTSESVSMISEAVRAGRPVLALHVSDTHRPKAKHQRFLDGLSGRYPLIVTGPSGLEAGLEELSRMGADGRSGEPDRPEIEAAARAAL
ncbi:MAG: Lipid A biosynthesis lauroyltransferase [Candidatus Omnitrophica bacterium]|nr:Lipid A biosynthesis lauroyltransferase [Candidatus Omnitrophota bacterium]